MKLRVLSWNIWCYGDIESVNEFLKKSTADIICLQEVVEENGRFSVDIDSLRTLGYNSCYAASMKVAKDGRQVPMGNMILSKYPITNKKVIDLSAKERRIAIAADIEMDNKTLHVFCTHLVHTHQKPSWVQVGQAKTLLSSLPKTNVIIAGDFNATPESEAIQALSSTFINTDPLLQPTWSTTPKGCDICRPEKVEHKLDYVFVSQDMRFAESRLSQSNASDHLPISVILEV